MKSRPNAILRTFAAAPLVAGMMHAAPAFAQGLIDAPSLIFRTYRIEETRQSIQDCADRTIVTGVIKYT